MVKLGYCPANTNTNDRIESVFGPAGAQQKNVSFASTNIVPAASRDLD